MDNQENISPSNPFVFNVLTLFPELIREYCSISLLGKAQKAGHIQVETLQIRDFATQPHYRIDDTPYGGGAGMVASPEPFTAAIAQARNHNPDAPVIALSPSGRRLRQKDFQQYAIQNRSLILLCGRYEGIDERIIANHSDDQVSLGDFVLMGGELAALSIIEGTARLLPSVLGNNNSAIEESYSDGFLLEAPQYTRPENFNDSIVPEILLSGDHKRIKAWRLDQSLARTEKKIEQEEEWLREYREHLNRITHQS